MFGLGLLLVSSVDKWEGCMRKSVWLKNLCQTKHSTVTSHEYFKQINKIVHVSRTSQKHSKVKKPVDHVGI